MITNVFVLLPKRLPLAALYLSLSYSCATPFFYKNTHPPKWRGGFEIPFPLKWNRTSFFTFMRNYCQLKTNSKDFTIDILAFAFFLRYRLFSLDNGPCLVARPCYSCQHSHLWFILVFLQTLVILLLRKGQMKMPLLNKQSFSTALRYREEFKLNFRSNHRNSVYGLGPLIYSPNVRSWLCRA